MVSDVEAPLQLRSGAITVVSAIVDIASASALMPGAQMPSSLEIRILIVLLHQH